MGNTKIKSLLLIPLSGLMACSNQNKNDKEQASNEKPNIIYIFTDQQSATMMSCTGNEWLETPAMDYIAENGKRFTRAYTTNPVCSPARVSMMTGRFPGIFSDDKGEIVRENAGSMKIPEISEEVQQTNIAAYLKSAGYDLYFGGKEHLPEPLFPANIGFTDITDNERDDLARKASNFIRSKHEKPYFLIVSLINPHDICYMALRDFSDDNTKWVFNAKTELSMLDSALRYPENISEEEFYENYCPTLPPNFEPQKDEPKAIGALLDERDFRRKARDNYTENDWRRHRWAYAHLTEFVDTKIQMVLDAIKETGQEKNTLVIFSSDHGDMNAAHRMEHKTALYEEAANIPFIAMWKGHIEAGQIDTVNLVSNGLDLLPTVCDYAGIKGVADPRGRSLRPLFENTPIDWRTTLGVESQIGRMVVDNQKFKYIRYDAVGIEEQLLDLNKDPFETTHFTNNPEYAEKLKELKNEFETVWFPGF